VPRSSLLCSRPRDKDEAAAQIGQKAQPAKDRRSCEAEAVTAKARRFTPAGFSVTVAACPTRAMTNLNYFLPMLLTEHGNAITGQVGLVQFP
jgi:hypothetical protein